jgi:Zn-dependent protease with chaperone function
MFSKPINFALVYIVTVFNIVILSSPLVAASIPFISFKDNIVTMDYGIYMKIKFIFFVLAFTVSFLMLLYLVLDFLIGFSMRSSLKNCTRYEKIKDYDFLADLFDQVKNKFSQRSVKLYIKNSDEINAFAVSSMGSRAIVLTRGLINHYLVECDDPKMFLYALRSVLSHEMSHLVNKDFLPTFLIIANQKVTNFTSSVLHIFFSFGVRAARFLPLGIGRGRTPVIILRRLHSFKFFSYLI